MKRPTWGDWAMVLTIIVYIVVAYLLPQSRPHLSLALALWVLVLLLVKYIVGKVKERRNDREE